MPVSIKGSGGGSVTLDAGAAAADTTLTLPNTSGTILQSGTAVTVAQGGTGAATLTANAVLIGNGTSAVTAVAPGVAGNVLTSNGTAWTSGAAPAFSAYNTSSSSYGAATFTKIPCSVEEFDTNSNYDTTNYRFTPTVAGYYQFNGCVYSSANTSLAISFYKNGSLFKWGNLIQTGAAGGPYAAGSALIYCNGSTDYVELYVYSAAANSFVSGLAATYFQGFLARGA